MIFARKLPELYIIKRMCIYIHNNCPKNIFPIFFLGGGARAPFASSYACASSALIVTLKHCYRDVLMGVVCLVSLRSIYTGSRIVSNIYN